MRHDTAGARFRARASVQAPELPAQPEYVFSQRHLPRAGIARGQLEQLLDIASAGLGVGPQQRLDQPVTQLGAELRRLPPPQAPRIVLARRLVVDGGDAARQDGIVDIADAVGGHEQQAIEVLQRAQELGDDGARTSA